MALPEGYKPEKDDIVAIRAVIKYDFDPDEDRNLVHVCAEGSRHPGMIIERNAIVDLLAKP